MECSLVINLWDTLLLPSTLKMLGNQLTRGTAIIAYDTCVYVYAFFLGKNIITRDQMMSGLHIGR